MATMAAQQIGFDGLSILFLFCVPDNLSVSAGKATLNAETVWGAVRGDYSQYAFEEYA